MNESNDDLRLRQLLRESRGRERLPPRFHERVWQRIATAEKSAAARPAFSLAAWLAAFVATRTRAAAWVVLLLGISVSTGYLVGGHASARWDAQLSRQYAASINPYLADNR
jgi:hypothetical protein